MKQKRKQEKESSMQDTEYIWFQLMHGNKIYELNLYEIICAIISASDNHVIPEIPQPWIDDVCIRYPILEEVEEFPIVKDNQLILKDAFVNEEEDDDGEIVYMTAIGNDTQFCIGLHLLLQMILIAEKEGFVPELDYLDFWQHIESMYYNYFETKGYHEIICTDLKLTQDNL